MTSEHHDDAVVEAFKDRMRKIANRLKIDLDDWIHQHNGDDMFDGNATDAPYSHHSTEVTAALLETAIDRKINLLGEKDARDLVMSAFDRRAKALRQRLQ